MKSLDLRWVEKFSSLTLSEDDSTNVIARQGSEPFQLNLSEGWALYKPKFGAARFSEKVRQYLTSKFEIGEQSGRKEDMRQVSQHMRKAKGENEERLFSREEWLTETKYKDFSSVCPPRDGDGQVRLRTPWLTINLTRKK